MKISIVLSTYNGEKYIAEQLASILQQSRQADEVLVYDDQSSDNTVNIIKNFIDEHKLHNWKIEINKVNKGWKRNFIEGIWASKGDIVFPCDQDDIWKPDKLAIMEAIMKENPEIELLTSNYRAFYPNGKSEIAPRTDDGCIIKHPIVQNIFRTAYPGCTYCIRRCLIEKSKSYWENDFPHDALYWRMSVFEETAYSINKTLINWRKHNTSTYALESVKLKSSYEKQKWFEYAVRVLKSILLYIDKQNVPNPIEKMLIIKKSLAWIELRQRFYTTKNPLHGIRLFSYLSCYDSFKQYLGDFYLVYFK